MGKKKMVMRRLAALLAASLVLTSSAFTSLAATGDGSENTPSLTLTASKTELGAGEEIKITAEVTSTASNASNSNAEKTLSWSADSDFVVITPKKGESVTVKVAEGAKVEKDTEVTITATGTLELDGKTDPNVKVTGTCKVTVKATETGNTPGTDEDDTPAIDPDLKPDNKNDEAVMDVIKEVDIPSGMQVSEIDTAEVEGELGEADLEKVTADIKTKTENVAKEVEEVDLADVEDVEPVKDQLKNVFEQIEGIDNDLDVELVVNAEKPKVKVKVTKGADGVARAEVVVVAVTINIDLFDQAGALVELKGKNNIDIKVPVMVPTSIGNAAWAKINHLGDWSKDKIKETADGKYINITTKHFSPFVITFSEEVPVLPGENTTTPSYGGGSRSSGGSRQSTASSQWIQNATGWWFKNADGTWPANTWVQLTWNNTSNWYRFNAEGYMVTGWFTDADQNRYFLHNVSDGTQGHMYTGWHQIDGRWYYFRENAGGPMGSLVVNGVTPDGYQVDANGVWIQ